MKRAVLIVCFLCISLRTWGNNPRASSGFEMREVESTWPGIVMQVIEVDRIAGNRLLVGVRLVATPNAPGTTLIGTPPVVPPNATKEELAIGFGPSAFSLEGSIMTEERTQEKYPMLPRNLVASGYRSSVIMASLAPREALILTIQFPAPPPPPPDDTGKIPKQTVSILLPRAKGPITKIVIPPPTPPAPGQ